MSPFAAIFERCRRPLAPESLEALARDLAAVKGGLLVARAEAATASTPEAASKGFARVEVLPRSPAEHQGRRRGEALDSAQLTELSGLAPAGTADEILLAGLRRFGRGVWSHIDGAFGCVLFNPEQHVLYLARDPVGACTLYFAEEDERVFVADRLQTLLLRGGSRSLLDSTQLARFFGLEPPRAGRTFFRRVREVEPGCVVEISEEGVRQYRFWTPQADALACGGSDEEYATRFRSLLREETRSFLDRPEELGIMLSGGIDSTSLAVLAAAGAAGGDSGAGRPAACSWVFDELGSCDERVWIDETLAELELEVIRVPGDDCWPLVDLDLFSTLPDSPYENPFRALKHKLYTAAHDRGRRLLLNGGPADLFYRGSNLYLRDLVRAGRVGTVGHCLVRQVRETGWRSAAGSIGRILRPAGRRRREKPAPRWLVGEARAAWANEFDGVSELDRGPRDVVPYLALESRGQAIENLCAAQSCVHIASPYWTRAWIDFMLSLPAHQIYRPGTNKFIARAAMRGVIPESIRSRQFPTLLDPLFDRGLFDRETKTVQDLLHGETPVWKDFVDQDFLGSVGPNSPSDDKLVLWHCLSFELWRRKHGWEVG